MGDELLEPAIGAELERLVREFRLRIVRKLAVEHRRSLYLVGGCLRDLLLGRSVEELDLAVDADPFPFARELARRLRGAFVLLDAEFGIARVVVKGPRGPLQYDFSRFKGKAIEEDLTLRDCTINALGLDLTAAIEGDLTRLLDPTGGAEALRRREMRACHARTFDDDPLRMLRLFRIGAQLDFALESQTLEAIRERAPLLDRVAPERITEELLKLLEVARCRPVVERLASAGLLAHVFPERPCCRGAFDQLGRLEVGLERYTREGAPVAIVRYLSESAVFAVHLREIVKLSALLVDLGFAPPLSSTFERLRLSARNLDAVRGMVRGMSEAPWRTWARTPDSLTIYRFYRDHEPHGPGIVLLGLAASEREAHRSNLEALETAFTSRPDLIDPPRFLDGKDVMAHLGLPSGPRIGWLLEQVREAQVDGRVHDRGEALALVSSLCGLGDRPSTKGAP